MSTQPDNASVTVDPRGFIKPPFTTCPKCGAEAFGVLMVCDYHYCRRCRNCLHPRGYEPPARFPLPNLSKSVVYLDQMAISNMMKALNPSAKGHDRAVRDGFWRPLFEKLDRLSKLQLLVS